MESKVLRPKNSKSNLFDGDRQSSRNLGTPPLNESSSPGKSQEKRKSKMIQSLPARLTEYSSKNRPILPTASKGSDNSSLLDLLPSVVSNFLAIGMNQTLSTPITQKIEACCLFLDISKFTVISEQFSLNSALRGPEILAEWVNKLFTQIVRLVSKSGGDVFKFAGDAMIVLWVVDAESSLAEAAHRAASCAWDIQATIPKLELVDGLALRLKIGLGVGKAVLIHIGLESGDNNNNNNTGHISAKPHDLSKLQAILADSHARVNSEAPTTPSNLQQQQSLENTSSGLNLLASLNSAAPPPHRPSSVTAHHPGQFRREFLVMGEPMRQAFASEHSADTGDIICSPETWELIKGSFVTKSKPREGFIKIDEQSVGIKKRKVERATTAPRSLLLSYVPRSAHLFLDVEDESRKDWVSELRRVTVLFVNIGITKSDIADMIGSGDKVNKLQQCFTTVQRCVIDYEGSINKFLIDDKGSTLVAVFGLPPISHENDAIRGVLCSLAISTGLQQLSVDPAVGIASGTAFCGVVGHPGGRREYTVLGDIVNLSARLMQRATLKQDGCYVDGETQYQAQDGHIEFQFVKQVTVKGKKKKVNVYRPHQSDRKKRNLLQRALFTRKHRRQSLDADWSKQVSQYSNVENRRKSFFSSINFDKLKAALSAPVVDPSKNQDAAILTRVLSSIGTDLSQPANSFLLEGSIGIGKSRALSILYDMIIQEKKHRVLFGVGNPFERGTLARPFGVFATIINQAIYTQHELNLSNKGSKASSSAHGDEKQPEDQMDIPVHDRQAIVLRWLMESKSRSSKFAWLLNEDLGVNFYDKSNVETGDVDDQNLLLIASKSELILDIVKGMAKENRICILIDDGMYLDQQSWALVLALALKGPTIGKGISIVMASRPVDEFVLIDAGSRSAYQKFRAIPTVKYDRINPLSPQQVTDLALSYMNVTSIPAVVELAITKCQGNPLFVREMLQGMIENNIIEVDRDQKVAIVTAAAAAKWQTNERTVSCSRCQSQFTSFNRRHHCRSCGRLFCANCAPAHYKRKVIGYPKPQRHCIECYETPSSRDFWTAKNLAGVVLDPPITIVCVMGTWIDKLSACQQMILKVASLTQSNMLFTKFAVFDAYPIAAHREILESEFADLISLGFIRLASLDHVGEKDLKYEFLHNFLPDVLSQRMLSSQRNELLFHVSEMTERRDIAARKEYRDQFRSEIMTRILMQGYVLVHKRVDKKRPWKRRWATISGYSLDMFREKKAIKAVASIDLRHASVNVETQMFADRQFVLRVDATQWSKHGDMYHEKRAFYFAPESNTLDESKNWAYFIKFGMETGQELGLGRSAAALSEATIRSDDNLSGSQSPDRQNLGSATRRKSSISEMLFGSRRAPELGSTGSTTSGSAAANTTNNSSSANSTNRKNKSGSLDSSDGESDHDAEEDADFTVFNPAMAEGEEEEEEED